MSTPGPTHPGPTHPGPTHPGPGHPPSSPPRATDPPKPHRPGDPHLPDPVPPPRIYGEDGDGTWWVDVPIAPAIPRSVRALAEVHLT